jgi:F0F1-type ATP synthase membrane subunit c/vacuolar-type H+-ATPase subunit K
MLTLNADMDVVLRLLGLASIFIGLGEGVCEAELAGSVIAQPRLFSEG